MQEERFYDIDHMASFIRFRFQKVRGIVVNGFYYRSSTCQWKGFNFCGCRLVDKDGSIYSMYQNCNRGKDSKTIP
jgi:hypothetical protein